MEAILLDCHGFLCKVFFSVSYGGAFMARRMIYAIVQFELPACDKNKFLSLKIPVPLSSLGGSQFFINIADNSFLDWFSPGSGAGG